MAADSNPGVPGTISVWRHRTEPYFVVGVWKSVYRFVSQVSSFGFREIVFLAAFMCVLQNVVLVSLSLFKLFRSAGIFILHILNRFSTGLLLCRLPAGWPLSSKAALQDILSGPYSKIYKP